MPSDQHKALTSRTPVSGRRILVLVFAFVQLLLGLFGLFGVFSYLADNAANPSRYQFLFVPAWTFILAVPLLIISVILYRGCGREMVSMERWLLNIACGLPLFIFAAVILVSVAGF